MYTIKTRKPVELRGVFQAKPGKPIHLIQQDGESFCGTVYRLFQGIRPLEDEDLGHVCVSCWKNRQVHEELAKEATRVNWPDDWGKLK